MTEPQAPPPPAKYLGPLDIARRLQVSGMTIYRLIQTGELPHIRIGRSIRISEADLAAYLKRNTASNIREAS